MKAPRLLALALLASGCFGATDDGGLSDGGPDAAVSDGGGGAAGPAWDGGVLSQCADLDTNDCFWNEDCAEGLRCQDVSGGEDVACCIVGTRGTTPAGEACEEATGEVECASGVCASGMAGTYCSQPCEVDEDCPENMAYCYPLFGTDGALCLP